MNSYSTLPTFYCALATSSPSKALVLIEDWFIYCCLFQFFFFFFAFKDVESYDPILNPVLNREVRRTGGRVLITLGDQDIDLSPSFVIFLSTRDPTVSRHHLGFIYG